MQWVGLMIAVSRLVVLPGVLRSRPPIQPLSFAHCRESGCL